MNYRVQHITNKSKLTNRTMDPQYLTVHSTSNETSTAQNERDNLNRSNNTTSTGFHIVVDDKEAIECIPLNMVAYHAGDGTNGTGNTLSIGMEICESGDRAKTLQNAVEVAAKILYEKDWGIERLKRHYDWSKKNCPRILNYNNWQGWNEFKSRVQGHLNLLNHNSKVTGNLYRVQVGAYTVKSNAEKMLNDLKLAGFNGFIKEEVIESEVKPTLREFDYYEKEGLKVIETNPENIYVAALPGKNLREFGIYGINGTWQNNSESHLPRSIWGLAVNNNKPIGPNAHQNSPNGYKRGTIIYYEDGSIEVKRINNINEIDKPVKWAIGGGMLLPDYNPSIEQIPADIQRVTAHTGIGYKGNRVYLIVTSSNCSLSGFKDRVARLNLDAAIFLDGGGSTQMNWKNNKGVHSARKLSHGVFIKGVV